MTDKYEYKCDGCGACCIHLAVTVYGDDLEREPRLNLIPLITFDDYKYKDKKYLNDGYGACPMLTEYGSCSIYETKPHVCTRFEPGSALCQWSRGMAGIHALRAELVTNDSDS